MSEPEQQQPKEYIITEKQIETIHHLFSIPEHAMDDADYMMQEDILAVIRSCPHTASAQERIGSIRQNIYQEDAYLIERVNAGMGEWEYVIQYCGEYCATAPSEEIARNIVKMAQHTCPVFTPEHDAAIARTAREDEREKILKAVTELFCIQKDSEAWRWLETLRQQE